MIQRTLTSRAQTGMLSSGSLCANSGLLVVTILPKSTSRNHGPTDSSPNSTVPPGFTTRANSSPVFLRVGELVEAAEMEHGIEEIRRKRQIGGVRDRIVQAHLKCISRSYSAIRLTQVCTMSGDRSCRNSSPEASKPPRQTVAVAAGTAADLEDARARLEVEHVDHQLADRLLVLVERRELPVQRGVVDLLGDAIVFAFGLGFDRAQFRRPKQIWHAVLDGKTAGLRRTQASCPSSRAANAFPERDNIERWMGSSIFPSSLPCGIPRSTRAPRYPRNRSGTSRSRSLRRQARARLRCRSRWSNFFRM